MIARLARDARAWEASLVGALLTLAALAWVATGHLAQPHMRMGLVTGAGSMSSMDPISPNVGTLSLFLTIWVVMMMAMMFPAVAPVVATVHRWVRRTGRSRADTAQFVAGYLVVWAAFGVLVYYAMDKLMPMLPTGRSAVRLGAGILILAGVYQFTPVKTVCLRHCRSPLAFIAQHATQLQRGGLAATRVGGVHGAFCLGCCWLLMGVLLVLGMMSLVWMAAVAAVIFAEKILPHGRTMGSIAGLALIGAGITVAVAPQTIPALT
jgi:predicted metal-binding membrane protein